MPTVAEQLRRAREEQKLSIYQVAEITKIKTDHVRALEAGDFGAFSAPVYIRGFIRTYAKVLKLDEKSIMAQLESELGNSEKFSEPPPLVDKPRTILDFLMLQFTRMNWRSLVVVSSLFVCLVLAINAIWKARSHRTDDPLHALGPGMYEPLNKKQAGEVLPLPSPPGQNR